MKISQSTQEIHFRLFLVFHNFILKRNIIYLIQYYISSCHAFIQICPMSFHLCIICCQCIVIKLIINPISCSRILQRGVFRTNICVQIHILIIPVSSQSCIRTIRSHCNIIFGLIESTGRNLIWIGFFQKTRTTTAKQ